MHKETRSHPTQGQPDTSYLNQDFIAWSRTIRQQSQRLCRYSKELIHQSDHLCNKSFGAQWRGKYLQKQREQIRRDAAKQGRVAAH